jgi:hypothetical protein
MNSIIYVQYCLISASHPPTKPPGILEPWTHSLRGASPRDQKADVFQNARCTPSD